MILLGSVLATAMLSHACSATDAISFAGPPATAPEAELSGPLLVAPTSAEIEGEIETGVDAVPVSAASIHFAWKHSSLTTPTSLLSKLFVVDASGNAPDQEIGSTDPATYHTAIDSGSFQFNRPDGFAAGTYRAEIHANGVRFGSRIFTVEPGPSASN